MRSIFDVDWHGLFVPTVSLLELVIRGSAVYLAIFTILRVFRRDAGALGVADLLVIVLVADAAQNAMAADYHSITEGVVLVGTIFGWNYLFDWLSYRYPWARRILQPKPLPLIQDGRVNRKNLRAEMLTIEDLNEQLRQQGIEDVSQVKQSFLEPDGHLSVIRQDDGPTGGKRDPMT